MAEKNVGYKKAKELIKHLRSGNWAEVKLCNIDGFFDVTCLGHLKDLLFDYGNNKVSSIEDIKKA